MKQLTLDVTSLALWSSVRVYHRPEISHHELQLSAHHLVSPQMNKLLGKWLLLCRAVTSTNYLPPLTLQLMGLFRYILRTPAACSRTFSSFCLLLPATAHFRVPFGPSDTVRATSSTTNWPVKPEAPKMTRWYGLLEVVSTRAIVSANRLCGFTEARSDIWHTAHLWSLPPEMRAEATSTRQETGGDVS